MPLFLLHDILPSGPAGLVFLGFLLVLFAGMVTVGIVALVAVVLGLLVHVDAGGRRTGLSILRDERRPTLGRWLVALAACMVAGLLVHLDVLTRPAATVLFPGAPVGMMLESSGDGAARAGTTAAATVFWALAASGAGPILRLLRHRRAMRGAGA